MRPEVIAVLLMLSFFALQDLRSRSISLRAALFFGAAETVLAFFHPHGSLLSFAAALLPGTFLFLICALTREGIGSGDAAVVCLMGLCLSVSEVALSLLAGLFLSFFYAAILLLSRRGRCRTSFPFLPFLLPGTVLFLLVSRSF